MEQTVILDNFIWSDPDDFDEHFIKISPHCSGAYFEIRYQPSNLAASPYLLAQHEESMRIMWAGELGESQEIENDIKEIHGLRKPFDALMMKLTPSLPRSANYLDSFLYPSCLVLEALAPSQDSRAVQPHIRGITLKYFGYYLRD